MSCFNSTNGCIFINSHERKIGRLIIERVCVMKEGGGDDVINVPKRAHKKIFYFNTLTSRNPAEC